MTACALNLELMLTEYTSLTSPCVSTTELQAAAPTVVHASLQTGTIIMIMNLEGYQDKRYV